MITYTAIMEVQVSSNSGAWVVVHGKKAFFLGNPLLGGSGPDDKGSCEFPSDIIGVTPYNNGFVFKVGEGENTSEVDARSTLFSDNQPLTNADTKNNSNLPPGIVSQHHVKNGIFTVSTEGGECRVTFEGDVFDDAGGPYADLYDILGIPDSPDTPKNDIKELKDLVMTKNPNVVATKGAVALLYEEKVYVCGNPKSGGSIPDVIRDELKEGIVSIHANDESFLAVKLAHNEYSVIVWGIGYGENIHGIRMMVEYNNNKNIHKLG